MPSLPSLDALTMCPHYVPSLPGPHHQHSSSSLAVVARRVVVVTSRSRRPCRAVVSSSCSASRRRELGARVDIPHLFSPATRATCEHVASSSRRRRRLVASTTAILTHPLGSGVNRSSEAREGGCRDCEERLGCSDCEGRLGPAATVRDTWGLQRLRGARGGCSFCEGHVGAAATVRAPVVAASSPPRRRRLVVSGARVGGASWGRELVVNRS